MSFAIHLFMAEKISEKSYRQFLGDAQNLFGNWLLEETTPFDPDTPYIDIHECWIKASDNPPQDWFRINVEASKHMEKVVFWGFDFEWHLRLETSVGGRSLVGLGVQLGAWLLAMETFRFVLALDRDTIMKGEPEEFRTIEAARNHAKRLIEENFKCSAELKRRGMLDDNGYILLPAARRIINKSA